MSFPDEAIQDSIEALIEGRTGSKRTVTAGRFVKGGEDGIPGDEVYARAVDLIGSDDWSSPTSVLYDLEIAPASRAIDAHPVSAGLSVESLTVNVVLTLAMETTENKTQRRRVKFLATRLHDEIGNALLHHNNLYYAEDGVTRTHLTGGKLLEGGTPTVRATGIAPPYLYVTAKPYAGSVSVQRN